MEQLWIFISDDEHETIIESAFDEFGIDEWSKTGYVEIHGYNAVTYQFVAFEDVYGRFIDAIKTLEPNTEELYRV